MLSKRLFLSTVLLYISLSINLITVSGLITGHLRVVLTKPSGVASNLSRGFGKTPLISVKRKALAHILEISTEVRVKAVCKPGIPALIPISHFWVSESAQGPLFGRIGRHSVFRAFLDPCSNFLCKEVAWRIFSLPICFSRELFQGGFIQNSDTERYQSRLSPRAETNTWNQTRFQRVSRPCDTGSASGRVQDHLVIHQDQLSELAMRRDLMILATTPTLVKATWILGSLKPDWNLTPNPAEEALWQGRNPDETKKCQRLKGPGEHA
jgi:hypothetical protein